MKLKMKAKYLGIDEGRLIKGKEYDIEFEERKDDNIKVEVKFSALKKDNVELRYIDWCNFTIFWELLHIEEYTLSNIEKGLLAAVKMWKKEHERVHDALMDKTNHELKEMVEESTQELKEENHKLKNQVDALLEVISIMKDKK